MLQRLHLLRGNVLLGPSPGIELGDVGSTVNVVKADLFRRIRCTVVKVEELHLVELLVPQEYFIGTQIGVHDILRMDKLEQVDDLQADINRLNFCEESELTLILLTNNVSIL